MRETLEGAVEGELESVNVRDEEDEEVSARRERSVRHREFEMTERLEKIRK